MGRRAPAAASGRSPSSRRTRSWPAASSARCCRSPSGTASRCCRGARWPAAGSRAATAAARPHAGVEPRRAAARPATTSTLPGNAAKLEAVDALADLADEAGLSLVHLALAFVLEHPAVTSAIIGPRTFEQLEAQLGADKVAARPTTCSTGSTRSCRRARPSTTRTRGYVPPALTDAALRRRTPRARDPPGEGERYASPHGAGVAVGRRSLPFHRRQPRRTSWATK